MVQEARTILGYLNTLDGYQNKMAGEKVKNDKPETEQNTPSD